MRTAAELREGFLSYFESKEHLRRPSAPLIPPADDASTLFIVAGMQPMKKWFLGAEEPPAKRVVTSQKVMRAGGKHADLDDVGSTARHASFFEMLGNFSFGDYFKAEAIPFAWEFVTEHMGFPEERLWATVFAGDPELGLGEDDVAVQGWLGVGLPRERIVGQPRSENFWQAADTGPCGPCSEIFYDRGPEHGCGDPTCGPNCERCERYLEFWNLVFMEYDLAADGTLTPLPQQNIDTGLGLERGAMLLQDVGSIFDTDGYQAIMRWVAEESGVAYGASEQATKAHRVLADHGRAMVFLISEGITPSNEGRGYIVRRLIRRAVFQGGRIGLKDVYRLPRVVIEQVAGAFPELVEQAAEIERVVKAEEERFEETLDRGTRELEGIVSEKSGTGALTSRASGVVISGAEAFKLQSTFGFPIELTVELAEENGLAVDLDAYNAEMAGHKEISRAGGESDAQRAADFARESDSSTFVGYHKTDVLTELHAYEDLGDGTFLAKLRETPFYAAGGGQVSDQGVIELDGDAATSAELVQVYRIGDDQVLLLRGVGFAKGSRVRAFVPWSVRFPTMANHTATHLLQEALREVLGDHVKQAGSAVRPDKLRFDFTHDRQLTVEEREQVEQRVNQAIFENHPLHIFETPIDEARKLGAMMLFGEKYGDIVRVVEIDGVSRELCGGTHVRSTAEIGSFAILSEGSVGSGARRIEAVTSGEAWALLHGRSRELDELRLELEEARKELKRKPAQGGGGGGGEVEANVRPENGFNLIVQSVEGLDGDALLDLSDRFKQRHSPAAVVLGGVDDGKVTLIANFDDVVADKVSASDVVKGAAALVGGGGGGRRTMARAGGKDPDRLADALAEAERMILAAI